MKTPELKRCPFCASGARIMFKPGIDSFYVECSHCRARTEGFCVKKTDEKEYVTSMFECMEAAADMWNRRRWLPE